MSNEHFVRLNPSTFQLITNVNHFTGLCLCPPRLRQYWQWPCVTQVPVKMDVSFVRRSIDYLIFNLFSFPSAFVLLSNLHVICSTFL